MICLRPASITEGCGPTFSNHPGIVSLEVIELLGLNERPFEALLYNPIDGFMPSFHRVSIAAIGSDVTWNIPKLKAGHILAVPVNDQPRPLCAFFVRDGAKLPDVLDITKIFT
jgi:hypothetical protein